ncbi:MAG: metal ABC transporter permease [Planctomycetes bacterium]|jgi:zinc transport system permease protein|nr:metal ABC transporter permease [Planctomycetota bacterium]
MANLLEWVEPSYMKQALAAMLLAAPLCAALGVQVVNQRMAFFADAVSHSAFTGVALGLLFHVHPVVTMVAFGLLVGLAVTRVRAGTELASDTVVGVFLAAAVAFGIAIAGGTAGGQRNLNVYLFGDPLTVGPAGLALLGGLFALVLGFLALTWNRLTLIGLDPSLARARGVSTRVYEYGLAAAVALVVTACIPLVGILVVTALLIVPAAAGRNLARSSRGMFWWSVGLATACALAGTAASYSLDSSIGATVVLFAAGAFFLSAVASRLRRRRG